MLVKTIDGVSEFIHCFDEMNRGEQFSYEGFKNLYYYLYDLGVTLQEKIEIDVIALCCDYAEVTLEIFKEYHYSEPEDCEYVIAVYDDKVLYINH